MNFARLLKTARPLVLASLVLSAGFGLSAAQAAAAWVPPRPEPGGPTLYMVQVQGLPSAYSSIRALEAGASPRVAGNRARSQASRNEQVQADVSAAIEQRNLAEDEVFRVATAFNGVAVLASHADARLIESIDGVRSVTRLPLVRPANSHSVPYIGGDDLWSLHAGSLTGQGISIGVIDTGVDYVHRTFGGSGTAPDLTAARSAAQNPLDSDLNPSGFSVTDGGTLYPSAKVAGAFDFAGDAYNADEEATATPRPDPNPMDCPSGDAGGHGTHVAGTAAGYGVTSGGNAFTGSYDGLDPTGMKTGPGVAPEADLYALRVFGCSGSSGLTVQALDWALDPNRDGNPADRLDVLNLSLGSDYGEPDTPDAKAATAASRAGTIVVIAAGNGGNQIYQAGSPPSSPQAITVANMVSSRLFDGIRITGASNPVNNGVRGGSASVAFDWEGLAAPVTGAGPAIEQADASSRPIEIRSGSGTVVVERSPFALRIRSSSGRTLLGTVKRSLSAGGVGYRGLGFTVGPDPELEPPSFDVSPEPPADGVSRFSATRVLSASVGRRSARIVIATNDPDGRRVLLRISRGAAGTAAVRARVFPAAGVGGVSASFVAGRGEAFHGFGGRREGTDLRGSDIRSWVLDYRYPDPTTAYYAPFPGFLSSRGYGVLLRGSLFSRWRMASDIPSAWRVSRPGAVLPLTVASGGTRSAMGAISRIGGRHRLPPAWSTGPMLSRTIGVVSDQQGGYQPRVSADLQRIEQGDLPVESYAFEGWGAMPREFVTEAIDRLEAVGVRAVLYLRSFVANDTAGTEQPGSFEDAISKEIVATDEAGDPYLIPSPFPGAQAAVIDFTDPDARTWWRNRVWSLLETGAEGFMNDFGEQVEPDMRFDDGSTGRAMRNRYPVLQAEVTRRAVDQWERANPGRRVFFFQRAGFGGSPGSAAFENAQFPGDETVDWSMDTGLPSIVPDMLNRAVTGAPGFTTDIGGYAQFRVESPFMPATGPELFTRWSQAAALTPFFRVHNSGLTGAMMPWDFGPEVLGNWKQMAELHNRARPLVRRLWKRFLETGVPMTRPLWLVDPKAARSPRADDQWLLGENVLVAPVLEEGATSRPVLFPSGCWRLEGKGPKINGGRELEVQAPLDRLPWFVRCGTSPLGAR